MEKQQTAEGQQDKPKGAKEAVKSRRRGSPMWSGGEYYDPSQTRSVPREIAQRQFLLIASELYGVTADLRDNVFPHFGALGAWLEQEPLRSALKNWCDRHRLWQPWVLSQVRDTLTIWKLVPQLAHLDGPNPLWHPLFDIVMRRPRPATTVPFVFTYVGPSFEVTPEGIKKFDESAGWDLKLERKTAFVAEARRQFEAKLRDYCAEQEHDAARRGLIKVKHSRASPISLLEKMKWTVHRHCKQMGFEQIAQEYNDRTGHTVDLSTIIKATNEISQLIELDQPDSET